MKNTNHFYAWHKIDSIKLIASKKILKNIETELLFFKYYFFIYFFEIGQYGIWFEEFPSLKVSLVLLFSS